MMKHSSIIYFLIILTSCVGGEDNNSGEAATYSSSNSYAKLFSIADSGSYYRLDIRSPWQGGENIVYTYYLVEEELTIPENLQPTGVIKIPIGKSVCMSTTHVAMIDAVGGADGILGVSGLDYVTNRTVRSNIDSGRVSDIGYDSNINNELIASLEPDIVFVYGIGSESAGYISKLKEAGIVTLYICDYLEIHPLAKAEWVKLFGLLYGKKRFADQLFDSVEASYSEVKNMISEEISQRPAVMLGLPYKDKWFVSPGNSYISTLIYDAGGSYIWSDYTSQESMPLSLEAVYIKGLEAQFWLNIGAADSRAELLSIDKRFENLPPLKTGNLYNNTLKLNESGGNDYWESGALFPDRVLKDLAYILHPEVIEDHDLYYYKKIE